jgi:hypothetical protein
VKEKERESEGETEGEAEGTRRCSRRVKGSVSGWKDLKKESRWPRATWQMVQHVDIQSQQRRGPIVPSTQIESSTK